jgi:hypothetical protein
MREKRFWYVESLDFGGDDDLEYGTCELWGKILLMSGLKVFCLRRRCKSSRDWKRQACEILLHRLKSFLVSIAWRSVSITRTERVTFTTSPSKNDTFLIDQVLLFLY